MSRGTNQKFKFTYLMKIMLAKTDDEHALTMPQIMEELEKYELNSSYVNWAISADNTVGGCPLFLRQKAQKAENMLVFLMDSILSRVELTEEIKRRVTKTGEQDNGQNNFLA